MRVLLGFLADDGRAAVQQIWSALAREGVAGDHNHRTVNPHISLAIVHEAHQSALEQSLTNDAKDLNPIPVTLPFYGVFTSPRQVVFLGVTVTNALYSVHRTLHETYGNYLDLEQLTAPTSWIPHCSLVLDIAERDLPQAIEVCQDFPLPIETHINRLAIVDNITLKTMWSVDLLS